jgi:tRNA-specific 2-thiouridylase
VSRRALVALSGGRDSALALYLVLEEGLEVRTACVDMGSGIPESARRVAGRFGCRLMEVDGREAFRRQVRLPTRQMLAAGLTPNPCAMCNRGPKMGLLHRMLLPGEVLVTGHYAFAGPGGLRRGVDRGKDQSYFLAMVERRVLDRCRLPLGGRTKEEVTAGAERLGLPHRRDESMDLCFDPAADLERPQWKVVDRSGAMIADGVGPMLPTVGQRLRLPGRPRRLYCVSLDPSSRVLVAGEDRDLLAGGCLMGKVNDLGMPDAPTFRGSIRIRYRKAPAPCLVLRGERGLKAVFDAPLRAVAPGQTAAVGIGDRVVAGGVIESSLKGGDIGR